MKPYRIKQADLGGILDDNIEIFLDLWILDDNIEI